MRAIVLGAAAGGGFPQWNCACANCRLAWAGDPRAAPRSQSGIAVSADGANWALINASIDLRQQILATPALHPREAGRHSPIAAILLTNADIDHIGGLLTLRERQAFALYASAETLAALDANPVFAALDPALIARRAIAPGQRGEILPGLCVETFAVPGKVALWRESGAVAIGAESGETVGVRIEAGGKRLVYIPGCAAISATVRATAAQADALLFDGTLYEDDEMIRAALSEKTGRRMGHMAIAGPQGSLAQLAGCGARRRIYVHINNTNPILIDGSPEARAVAAAGWEIARDGMEISL